ncbi:MAG TPA: DnaA/Hda family protein [Longimicrobiaceae bacterium]
MPTPLDPRCSFERFIVGPANRVAAAAAVRAAEAPGRIYNPLVIAGAPGLGKTHLLMAIGQRARMFDAELRVHYETGEEFVDRVTAALAAGTLEAFRAAMASVDLLLLDGLDQVAGKGRTEEELLRLAGEMLGRGRQLVIASEAPPAAIPHLHPSLLERVSGGLNVEIASPDPATRRAIVTRLVANRDQPFPEAVTAALTQLPLASVPAIQEAVDRLLAVADLEGREVRLEDVSRVATMTPHVVQADEFDDFLADISTAVAAVVETAPWRRRLAEAILRWEGEGICTRRLEAALDADSAPDVEALLTSFGRDVGRLRRIARELPPGVAVDPLLLRDPDRLQEAERLLAENAPTAAGSDRPGAVRRAAAGLPRDSFDRWFLDREKLAWDWLALDDRIVEEQR